MSLRIKCVTILTVIYIALISVCMEGCYRGNEKSPTEEHVVEAYGMALEALKDKNWLGTEYLIYSNERGETLSVWVYRDELVQLYTNDNKKELHHDGYIYIYNLETEEKTKRKDAEPDDVEKYKQQKEYYRERVVEILESDMKRELSQWNDSPYYSIYPDNVVLKFDREELDKNGYKDMGEEIKIETRRGEKFTCIQMVFKTDEEIGKVITIRTASDEEWMGHMNSSLDEYEYIE